MIWDLGPRTLVLLLVRIAVRKKQEDGVFGVDVFGVFR